MNQHFLEIKHRAQTNINTQQENVKLSPVRILEILPQLEQDF